MCFVLPICPEEFSGAMEWTTCIGNASYSILLLDFSIALRNGIILKGTWVKFLKCKEIKRIYNNSCTLFKND